MVVGRTIVELSVSHCGALSCALLGWALIISSFLVIPLFWSIRFRVTSLLMFQFSAIGFSWSRTFYLLSQLSPFNMYFRSRTWRRMRSQNLVYPSAQALYSLKSSQLVGDVVWDHLRFNSHLCCSDLLFFLSVSFWLGIPTNAPVSLTLLHFSYWGSVMWTIALAMEWKTAVFSFDKNKHK